MMTKVYGWANQKMEAQNIIEEAFINARKRGIYYVAEQDGPNTFRLMPHKLAKSIKQWRTSDK